MPRIAIGKNLEYTELCLTIWLIEDILNCNKIKDCIISLETFEKEIEYPFR